MSLQKRAFRIVRDVIGIVLDWNDRHLSDKEAMKEITRSLLIHKENENTGNKFDRIDDIDLSKENSGKVLGLEEKKEASVEDKKEEVKIEEKEYKVQIKKDKKLFQNFKAEKKLVAPIIIGGFFLLIVVGIVNPYEIASNFEIEPSAEDKSIQFREIPSDNSAIRTEQFLEIPSEAIEKIQNGTKVASEP